jgi:hypothetical protein
VCENRLRLSNATPHSVPSGQRTGANSIAFGLHRSCSGIKKIDMNGTFLVPHSPISIHYWDMLKGLSDTVKMELVALLSASIVNKEDIADPEMTEEEKDREFWSLCGCWKDDPEDAARMESVIKDGRKNVFMREINLDD